jgi:hypothetical protein
MILQKIFLALIHPLEHFFAKNLPINSDSRIRKAIEHVCDKVTGDDHDCGKAGGGENYGIVAAKDGFEGDAAHAGPGKDDFSEKGAAKQEGQAEAEK